VGGGGSPDSVEERVFKECQKDIDRRLHILKKIIQKDAITSSQSNQIQNFPAFLNQKFRTEKQNVAQSFVQAYLQFSPEKRASTFTKETLLQKLGMTCTELQTETETHPELLPFYQYLCGTDTIDMLSGSLGGSATPARRLSQASIKKLVQDRIREVMSQDHYYRWIILDPDFGSLVKQMRTIIDQNQPDWFRECPDIASRVNAITTDPDQYEKQRIVAFLRKHKHTGLVKDIEKYFKDTSDQLWQIREKIIKELADRTQRTKLIMEERIRKSIHCLEKRRRTRIAQHVKKTPSVDVSTNKQITSLTETIDILKKLIGETQQRQPRPKPASSLWFWP